MAHKVNKKIKRFFFTSWNPSYWSMIILIKNLIIPRYPWY